MRFVKPYKILTTYEKELACNLNHSTWSARGSEVSKAFVIANKLARLIQAFKKQTGLIAIESSPSDNGYINWQ